LSHAHTQSLPSSLPPSASQLQRSKPSRFLPGRTYRALLVAQVKKAVPANCTAAACCGAYFRRIRSA
jgi:hypothetical protein